MDVTSLRKEICCMNLNVNLQWKNQKLVHIQYIFTFINYVCFKFKSRYFSWKVGPIMMHGKYTERIIFSLSPLWLSNHHYTLILYHIIHNYNIRNKWGIITIFFIKIYHLSPGHPRGNHHQNKIKIVEKLNTILYHLIKTCVIKRNW